MGLLLVASFWGLIARAYGGGAFFQGMCMAIEDLPLGNPVSLAMQGDLWSLGRPNKLWVFSTHNQGYFDVYSTATPHDPIAFWLEPANTGYGNMWGLCTLWW